MAEVDGLSTSRTTVVLLSGQQQKRKIKLLPAVHSVVKFQAESGQPIVGVKLRSLRYLDVNGEFYPCSPASQNMDTVGLNAEASGPDGLMQLPTLPEGTVIKNAIFDHADFAPAEMKDVPVTAGQVATVTMHPGVKLTVKIDPVDGKSVDHAILRIVHSDSRNPSTRADMLISFGADGTARLNVDLGKYFVWLRKADGEEFAPIYEGCEIGLGRNDTLTFTAPLKVQARGRAINAETGEPITNAWITADVPNQPAEGWRSSDSAKTDPAGQYVLKVPAGRIRLMSSDEKVAMTKSYIEADVRADGSTILPNIEMLPNPKLNGRVFDPAGNPVAGAIVRLQGIYRLDRQPPTATDRNGCFELPIKRVPSGVGLSTPQMLDVLEPTKPLSARTEVCLDQAKTLTDMTIRLQPERYKEFLDRAIIPLTEPERERLSERAQRLQAFPALVGQPAPALDGQAWLNTDKPMMSLADFRGKYVLLDFWAVWCGPCHADFPDVKLLNETYKDHGLVVIGVADNSTDPELVREHLKQQGLTFPIVVDQRDGRIFSAYQKFGIARRNTKLCADRTGWKSFDDRRDMELPLRIHPQLPVRRRA